MYTSGYIEQDVLLFGLLDIHATEIKSYGYYMQVVADVLLKTARNRTQEQHYHTFSTQKLRPSS